MQNYITTISSQYENLKVLSFFGSKNKAFWNEKKKKTETLNENFVIGI